MKLDPRELPALHDYACEIARELGAPWRYDHKASRNGHSELWHYAALMPGLSDYGVNVRIDWHRNDRLEITGRIPSKDREGNTHYTWYEPHDGKRPAITVAISRGPRAAARDIVARLLPVYDPVYAKARGRVDAANRDLDRLHRARKILAPFGERLSISREYSGRWDGRFSLADSLGRARIHAPSGRVDLEISVQPEVAARILRLVKRARAAAPEEE